MTVKENKTKIDSLIFLGTWKIHYKSYKTAMEPHELMSCCLWSHRRYVPSFRNSYAAQARVIKRTVIWSNQESEVLVFSRNKIPDQYFSYVVLCSCEKTNQTKKPHHYTPPKKTQPTKQNKSLTTLKSSLQKGGTVFLVLSPRAC